MIGLVHLVWAPLGPEPLRAFLRSYEAHPAGAEHELAIVLNGATHDTPAGGEDRAWLSREDLLAELEGTAHRLIELERPLTDLAAYGEAARRLEHEWLCFVNSYAVILAGGWLGHLAHAAELPDVGIVGATGSWESQSPLVHGNAWHWLYQLAMLPRARIAFPRFPNPHIRTTAFMLRRRLVLELSLERAQDKYVSYLLESGRRRGITRQIQAQGLRAVVVGRDGRTYDTHEWLDSHTFRSGEQENLLVADNRTSDWQRGSPSERKVLSDYAWKGGIRPG
jgi:hypothetical protein